MPLPEATHLGLVVVAHVDTDADGGRDQEVREEAHRALFIVERLRLPLCLII